jgi:hypothetical protein
MWDVAPLAPSLDGMEMDGYEIYPFARLYPRYYQDFFLHFLHFIGFFQPGLGFFLGWVTLCCLAQILSILHFVWCLEFLFLLVRRRDGDIGLGSMVFCERLILSFRCIYESIL